MTLGLPELCNWKADWLRIVRL